MKAIAYRTSGGSIVDRFHTPMLNEDVYEAWICVDGVHVALVSKLDDGMSSVGVEHHIIGLCDGSCNLDLGNELENTLTNEIREFLSAHNRS